MKEPKFYTFAELLKMGIKKYDLKYRMYRDDNYLRFGVTVRQKIVDEKVVSEESFKKYFKKLIKKNKK